MRNVAAGERVLRNLPKRRGIVMGSKHRTRGIFRNWPIWKGFIVWRWIGDGAIEPIKRVVAGGLSQGTVPSSTWFARSSNQ